MRIPNKLNMLFIHVPVSFTRCDEKSIRRESFEFMISPEALL